ncbi:hypothetical protein SK128_012905, partial [Halocaridina rubra]
KNLISLAASVFHIWTVCKAQVLKNDVSEKSLQLKESHCETNSLKYSVETFEKSNQELEKENCKLQLQLQAVHQNNTEIQQMLSDATAEHCNQKEQNLSKEKNMLSQLRMFEETITELEDMVDEGRNEKAKLLHDLNEVTSAKESFKAQIEDMKESFNTIAMEVENDVEDMKTEWAKTDAEHCNRKEQILSREKDMVYTLRIFEETITELKDMVDEGRNEKAKLLHDLNEVTSAKESLKAQIEDLKESFNTIAMEVECDVEEMKTEWAKTETEAEEKMYKMQMEINELNIEADELERETDNQRHLIDSLQSMLWQKKDKKNQQEAQHENSYHDIKLDVMQEAELEEKITYLEEIGKGGNGAAHRITFDQVNCVLKTFHTGKVDIIEARIMKYLDGAGGAPKLLGISVSKLVCTSAGDIGMDEIFARMKEENLLLQVVYEVARQIEKLHKKNIIHCDLKLDNIIYDPEVDKINIIDFGLSCMLGEQVFRKGESRAEERDRCTWMAPELHEGEPATFASDVYSLGFLLACALVRFAKPNQLALYLVGIATLKNPVKRPSLEEFMAIVETIHSDYDDAYKSPPNLAFVLERAKKLYPVMIEP